MTVQEMPPVMPELRTFPESGYPPLFGHADAIAKTGRLRHTWLTRAALALLVAATAVHSAAAAVPGEGAAGIRWLPALLFAAAMAATIGSRWGRYDAPWFDGRAVAETAKTLSWRYMMRTPPFDGVDPAAELVLARALQESLTARPGLAARLAATTTGHDAAATATMRQVRELPLAARRDLYLAARVADQIAWYAGKAAANSRAGAACFWIGLIATVMALAAALLVAVAGLGAAAVSSLAVLAAAALAWSHLGHHDELRTSYALAADELTLLGTRLEGCADEATLARLVAETELAISREHTMGIGKRG